MNDKRWIAAKVLFVLLVIPLMGAVVMGLWNWVVVDLFTGARAIDFPHAVGLLVLSRILFGGFRGRGGWHHRRHGPPRFRGGEGCRNRQARQQEELKADLAAGAQ